MPFRKKDVKMSKNTNKDDYIQLTHFFPSQDACHDIELLFLTCHQMYDSLASQ
jgi:hypothetical protein